MDGVWLEVGVCNGENFRMFGDGGIRSELIDEIVDMVVDSFVGDAVGIDGGTVPGNGDSIAGGLEVGTVVVGSPFKLGNGIIDGEGVVGS